MEHLKDTGMRFSESVTCIYSTDCYVLFDSFIFPLFLLVSSTLFYFMQFILILSHKYIRISAFLRILDLYEVRVG